MESVEDDANRVFHECINFFKSIFIEIFKKCSESLGFEDLKFSKSVTFEKKLFLPAEIQNHIIATRYFLQSYDFIK